jgi:hypothetical protein
VLDVHFEDDFGDIGRGLLPKTAAHDDHVVGPGSPDFGDAAQFFAFGESRLSAMIWKR